MNRRNNQAFRIFPSLFYELDDINNLFTTLDKEAAPSNNVSIYEDDKNTYIEAFIPGIKNNEVDISLDKGMLLIKAESKEEKNDVKYHLKSLKNFSYRIPMPNKIDDFAEPEAICKDGILKIIFKKISPSQTKKIQIKFE